MRTTLAPVTAKHALGSFAGVSKKQRRSLTKILSRDDDRCGIHAGGCGEKIEPTQHGIDRDHIYPKAYFKGRPNASQFNDLWNLQPMHRDCHELRGRGQIVSGVSFRCTCHYNYADEQGNRFVYYKQPSESWYKRRDSNWRERKDTKWNRSLYHTGRLFEGVKIEGQPNVSDRTLAFTLIAGSTADGKGKGFARDQIGHLMVPFAPFHRLLYNSTGLLRCQRWTEVLDETKKFAALRKSAGEARLINETGTAYLQALIECHMQSYIAGMFTTNGFANGAVLLSDRAIDMPSKILEDIGKITALDDEASKRTVSIGVLYEILTYVEHLLAVGVIQVTGADDEATVREHIAGLKSEIEMKVPYITQQKQWPNYSPRPGIDYW